MRIRAKILPKKTQPDFDLYMAVEGIEWLGVE
jgi:hypothetical protein